MSARTLVTGGSSGIGLAVARQELAAGRAVVVLDREPPPPTSTPASCPST